MLESWNDTATRAAIESYVTTVTTDGPDFVPPEERIAVFDNDGTLWTEKPIPIQLDIKASAAVPGRATGRQRA